MQRRAQMEELHACMQNLTSQMVSELNDRNAQQAVLVVVAGVRASHDPFCLPYWVLPTSIVTVRMILRA